MGIERFRSASCGISTFHWMPKTLSITRGGDLQFRLRNGERGKRPLPPQALDKRRRRTLKRAQEIDEVLLGRFREAVEV